MIFHLQGRVQLHFKGTKLLWAPGFDWFHNKRKTSILMGNVKVKGEKVKVKVKGDKREVKVKNDKSKSEM